MNENENINVKKQVSVEEVEDWMVFYLSNLIKLPEDEIDITVDFRAFGLDSSSSVGMTGDLAEWLGVELEETLLFNHPTVEKVAQYVVTLD